MRISRSFVALTLSIALFTVFISGCIGAADNKSTVSADSAMGQIDTGLAKGPVFVEFGASWCEWCTKEKPIVEGLSQEYPGITFINVDTDNDTELAQDFYVNAIPQMNLIVRKNTNGSYLYIDATGEATADRKKSAIIGYTEQDQLKPILDAALKAR